MKLKEETRYWKEQINLQKIWAPALLILAGVGCMALATILFFELAEEVWEQEKFAFDHVILDFFQTIEDGRIDIVMKGITETGSFWWITIGSIITILILWWKRRDLTGILFFLLAIGGGGIFIFILKYVFQRPRPSTASEYDGTGFSFPSGHTLGSFIFYGFIVYLIAREKKFFKIRMIAILCLAALALSVGLSRVYLNVHYPSDILAGYAVGLIWLSCCIFSMELIKVYRN
jgi:undecaprenyl-diphosphatase